MEAVIQKWVQEKLSLKQSFLNSLPPCPFAAEALLKKEVCIQECTASSVFQNVADTLSQFNRWPQKMHIWAVRDWQELSLEEVSRFVGQQRSTYFKNDLWLLYDHPSAKEVVHDFCFNHGDLLIFMIQRLSDLVFAARNLQKSGYYQNWPQEYFEEIFLLRENYYQQYLHSLQSSVSL
jgi:hypothetical protein